MPKLQRLDAAQPWVQLSTTAADWKRASNFRADGTVACEPVPGVDQWPARFHRWPSGGP